MSRTLPQTRTRAAEGIASNGKSGERHKGEIHGRVLALDYGRKRIGLAISDELALTAQPLGTMNRENRRKDLSRLRKICREQGVKHIIVGYPLHMNGQAGDMAIEAEAFARRLALAVQLTVELVDERLTSWEARQKMKGTKSAARGRREPIDHVAAAVLLGEYLDRKRGSSHSNMTETD